MSSSAASMSDIDAPGEDADMGQLEAREFGKLLC